MHEFLTFLLDDDIMPINSEQLSLNKGDRLQLEDAVSNSRYVFGISEGIIALQQDESILDFSTENHFIGLYTDMESRIYGKILSETATVWRFDLRDILAKISLTRNGFLLYNKHAMSVHDSLIKKISIMKLNNPNKLILSLRSLASRFGEPSTDKEARRLPLCFTKTILSNYTGIKSSSLTHVLNKLHDEGKIMYSRRVILVYI
ncbi:Crp/Fnr family transcriptional regulator [Listeria newyorkensis]|uniref:Crp/Fnr family transcriptional regulator n=1 Tax=Listeria newyorkensis TaxID=1497681 RepID=A0A841YYV5_9LIST|nr:Crp/Fnr family transcriptional regulator [Listeria newyorkensis]MBC1459091.1 Crp/Fnr family transcriptional regulator [Listeria newyorkensis]